MAVATVSSCEVSSSGPFVAVAAPSSLFLSGSIAVRHEAVEVAGYFEDLKLTILKSGHFNSVEESMSLGNL